MTAQQQLAELNAVCSRLWSRRHSESEAAAFYNKAGKFIRDHGPAIAELIETQAQILATESPASTRAFAELCNRRTDAIRKLTQDA